MSGIQIVHRAAAIAATLFMTTTGLGSASAQDMRVLPSTSPWNLDYAEDRCRLIRNFGEDDSRTVLVMEQLQPSSHIEFIVAGKPLRQIARGSAANVRMGPGFDAFERDFQKGNLGPLEPALIFGSISPVHGLLASDDNPETDDVAVKEDLYHPQGTSLEHSGAAIDWIEISRKKQTVRLDTGPMAKPFAALNTCTEDLLTSWGVDPAVVASVAVGPELTNIQEVASRVQRDYPKKALARGQMANIQLRLVIDEAGEIADCTQLNLTVADNFTDVACDVFRERANYKPARDASGKPVRTFEMQRIRYIIP